MKYASITLKSNCDMSGAQLNSIKDVFKKMRKNGVNHKNSLDVKFIAISPREIELEVGYDNNCKYSNLRGAIKGCANLAVKQAKFFI